MKSSVNAVVYSVLLEVINRTYTERYSFRYLQVTNLLTLLVAPIMLPLRCSRNAMAQKLMSGVLELFFIFCYAVYPHSGQVNCLLFQPLNFYIGIDCHLLILA
jgi:hypothetical protein